MTDCLVDAKLFLVNGVHEIRFAPHDVVDLGEFGYCGRPRSLAFRHSETGRLCQLDFRWFDHNDFEAHCVRDDGSDVIFQVNRKVVYDRRTIYWDRVAARDRLFQDGDLIVEDVPVWRDSDLESGLRTHVRIDPNLRRDIAISLIVFQYYWKLAASIG
jgi:hypothetical protein